MMRKNNKKILKIMRKKNGAIEVQMNWIFIAIIGTIILLFFVGVAVKQRSASHQRLVGDIVKDLDSYISGSLASTQAATIIPIPDFEVEFDCNEYRIEGQRNLLESRVVFGTDRISSDDRQLIVWSLPWNMPYLVTNFLYITGPGVKYVFAYKQSQEPKYGEFYEDFMTDKINKEKVYIDASNKIDFADEKNYKLKIIVLGGQQVTLPQFAYNERTTLIIVSPFDTNTQKYPVGNIDYYQYDKSTRTFQKDGDTVTFIGLPSLVGAIFSDNRENFACTMEKAVKNLNVVNKVVTEKVKLLSNRTTQQQLGCSIYYSTVELGHLDNMNNATQVPGLWMNKVSEIVNTAGLLDTRNTIIEQQSCPLLY
ncbi:hypothetical protein KY336_00855 [Candidatus Woesearchaeota archaeon]|nr:hypothetical protein [Candidatus Woesearchaeota archaeon]